MTTSVQVTDRRTFTLMRETDVTGVTGVGVIAEGAQFSNGTVVLVWKPQPERASGSSVAIWPDLKSLLGIHGHDGKTTVCWD